MREAEGVKVVIHRDQDSGEDEASLKMRIPSKNSVSNAKDRGRQRPVHPRMYASRSSMASSSRSRGSAVYSRAVIVGRKHKRHYPRRAAIFSYEPGKSPGASKYSKEEFEGGRCRAYDERIRRPLPTPYFPRLRLALMIFTTTIQTLKSRWLTYSSKRMLLVVHIMMIHEPDR
ncbi:hypothetical protein M7I_6549 [Glarea lozoyensis 74030]|uniref:Uncharacterized protein n=1 Tax=Glarea lozoyensis (strain ATCC 74030 / MF5533) TaxID=1104152 RepID=H0EUW0_GLAL7|nr:hypothetical protein M7I_6549 [Glarea lozoyensis 74030]